MSLKTLANMPGDIIMINMSQDKRYQGLMPQ